MDHTYWQWKTSKNKKYACAVPYCLTDVRKRSEKVSLFSLPVNKVLRRKWLLNLRMHEKVQNVRICSEHFLESDFYPKKDDNCKKMVLKEGSVPSQKLPHSSFQRKPISAEKLSAEKRGRRAVRRARSQLLKGPFKRFLISHTVTEQWEEATVGSIEELDNEEDPLLDFKVKEERDPLTLDPVKFEEVAKRDEENELQPARNWTIYTNFELPSEEWASYRRNNELIIAHLNEMYHVDKTLILFMKKDPVLMFNGTMMPIENPERLGTVSGVTKFLQEIDKVPACMGLPIKPFVCEGVMEKRSDGRCANCKKSLKQWYLCRKKWDEKQDVENTKQPKIRLHLLKKI